MIRPAISGTLVVDISRYVDRDGMLTADGTGAAWGPIAAAPAGIPIELCIGALRTLAGSDIVYHLGYAGIRDAGSIDVRGFEPDGVRAVVQALCAMRDSGRGA